MRDIMIDIETLGTYHDAVITQIGACRFERLTGEIGEELEVNVRINSCLERGMTVTEGSINFWMEREGTWKKDPVSLKRALSKLSYFIKKDQDSILWCHATFDIPIIANAYKVINEYIPWKFRNARDIRTLVDLAGVEYNTSEDRDEKTHDALEDCRYQVNYCKEAFNKLQHTG